MVVTFNTRRHTCEYCGYEGKVLGCDQDTEGGIYTCPGCNRGVRIDGTKRKVSKDVRWDN